MISSKAARSPSMTRAAIAASVTGALLLSSEAWSHSDEVVSGMSLHRSADTSRCKVRLTARRRDLRECVSASRHHPIAHRDVKETGQCRARSHSDQPHRDDECTEARQNREHRQAVYHLD